MWIGEWMAARDLRDEMVVATKYSVAYKLKEGVMRSNYGGNSTKSMHVSVEASLKKLQTSYIDLVSSYPHSTTTLRGTNLVYPPALRPLLGHDHLCPRTNAIPKPPRRRHPQSPLPRHLRHPRLGRRQMQRLRP